MVARGVDNGGQQRGRGAEHDLGVAVGSGEREERLDEGDGFVGSLVHLPVGGDEFFAWIRRHDDSISFEGVGGKVMSVTGYSGVGTMAHSSHLMARG
jgi:hypothetical protein